MILLHILAKGVYGHNSARDAVGQSNSSLKKFKQALIGAVTQLSKQLSIVLKIYTQDNRDTEDILAMGNRIEDIFLYRVGKLDHLLGMAGRAKPSSLAGESKMCILHIY